MKYVDAETADWASEGTWLGCTKPCAESKGMWYVIYWREGRVIACICDGGLTGGDDITGQSCKGFCDEYEAADLKVKELNAGHDPL